MVSSKSAFDSQCLLVQASSSPRLPACHPVVPTVLIIGEYPSAWATYTPSRWPSQPATSLVTNRVVYRPRQVKMNSQALDQTPGALFTPDKPNDSRIQTVQVHFKITWETDSQLLATERFVSGIRWDTHPYTYVQLRGFSEVTVIRATPLITFHCVVLNLYVVASQGNLPHSAIDCWPLAPPVLKGAGWGFHPKWGLVTLPRFPLPC